MSTKWTEFDPYTGVTEINYTTDDDDVVLTRREQDVAPLLDRQKELANTGATNEGIKNGLWHYASIPVTVQYELLKKGINIHNPEDHPRMFAEINANYPYLKTTNKTHEIKRHRASLLTGSESKTPSGSPSAATSTQPGPFVIVR